MSAIFHTKRTLLQIRDTLDNIRFEYVSKEIAGLRAQSRGPEIKGFLETRFRPVRSFIHLSGSLASIIIAFTFAQPAIANLSLVNRPTSRDAQNAESSRILRDEAEACRACFRRHRLYLE